MLLDICAVKVQEVLYGASFLGLQLVNIVEHVAKKPHITYNSLINSGSFITTDENKNRKWFFYKCREKSFRT